MLTNVNGQQTDRMRKNIVKVFKDTGFAIDVETNLETINLLDITFNMLFLIFLSSKFMFFPLILIYCKEKKVKIFYDNLGIL